MEGALARCSRPLPAETFRTFEQVTPGGAGGARTHDRRIMRSTASCAMRASCTDGTGNRADGVRRAGIVWRAGPRTGPRRQAPMSLRPATVRNIAKSADLRPCDQVRRSRSRQAVLQTAAIRSLNRTDMRLAAELHPVFARTLRARPTHRQRPRPDHCGPGSQLY